MTHSTFPSLYTPVWTAEQKVCQGFEELELGQSYEQLRSHAKASLAGSDLRSIEGVRSMQPTYFERHVRPMIPAITRKQKTAARRAAALIGALERAAACCILAAYPFPKPLCAMLDEVRAQCRHYEELKILHAQEDAAVRRRCARGGHARQANNKALWLCRRLAIRLLRTKAPDSKWKNQTKAAETLGQCLSEIAAKHNLSVSHSAETWARNVANLIRSDPRAGDVFQRHCKSRRCNRQK